MILIDANLLVYAHVEQFAQHRRSKEWFVAVLEGDASVGLPWPSLLAFVRIVTNRRIFPAAISLAAAWGQVERWLNVPNVWIPGPTASHRNIVRTLIVLPGLRGDHLPDLHLAALAIEHGLVLHAADGDFARFPNLRWKNPLAA